MGLMAVSRSKIHRIAHTCNIPIIAPPIPSITRAAPDDGLFGKMAFTMHLEANKIMENARICITLPAIIPEKFPSIFVEDETIVPTPSWDKIVITQLENNGAANSPTAIPITHFNDTNAPFL